MKKIAALAAVPIVIGGWALFRPELLFVDQKVNEKLPVVAGQSSQIIGEGSFTSYAHETNGRASLLKSGDKTFLRLSDFKTSNGPDVHVYLVKGSDASQSGVNQNGFVDLGTIKGNEGDQNYELPSGLQVSDFGGVAIWCKRFSVNFGGATLTPKQAHRTETYGGFGVLTGFGGEIRVTSGPLKGQFPGTAELIESSGKRFVRIRGLKGIKGRDVRVLLVKYEEAKTSKDVIGSEKIDLGKARDGVVQFPIGDKVDAWLYRSVSLWDVKAMKSLSIAHLRSDQEKKPTNFFA